MLLSVSRTPPFWLQWVIFGVNIKSYIYVCVKNVDVNEIFIFIKPIHEGHIYIVVLGKDFNLVVNNFFINCYFILM